MRGVAQRVGEGALGGTGCSGPDCLGDMTDSVAPTHDEPHREGLAQRLNWLRAGVLGANDGIVSVAAIVVGVAGATTDTAAILTAGVAGLVGGAISMALGEYVSVSSQRDSERALIAKEKRELHDDPEAELDELTELYRARGLTAETARQVASELTEHDALAAHLSAELNIDADDVVNPWHAAIASAAAFTLGALSADAGDPVAAAGLAGAGDVRRSARGAGDHRCRRLRRSVAAPASRASLRVVVGGALALTATYAIGTLLEHHRTCLTLTSTGNCRVATSTVGVSLSQVDSFRRARGARAGPDGQAVSRSTRLVGRIRARLSGSRPASRSSSRSAIAQPI